MPAEAPVTSANLRSIGHLPRQPAPKVGERRANPVKLRALALSRSAYDAAARRLYVRPEWVYRARR